MENKNLNSITDYEAIINTMKTYTEGFRTGDTTIFNDVFTKDAVMYGYWNGHFVEGSIENLHTSVKHAGAAPNIISHVSILDKTTTTAVVRNEVEANATGDNFTEFHSLIKEGDDWKIVSKVFHKYDK